jgi:hypothetical protein
MQTYKKYKSLSAIKRDILFLEGEIEAKKQLIGVLEVLADEYACKTEDQMCKNCTCWKRTRELCS